MLARQNSRNSYAAGIEFKREPAFDDARIDAPRELAILMRLPHDERAELPADQQENAGECHEPGSQQDVDLVDEPKSDFRGGAHGKGRQTVGFGLARGRPLAQVGFTFRLLLLGHAVNPLHRARLRGSFVYLDDRSRPQLCCSLPVSGSKSCAFRAAEGRREVQRRDETRTIPVSSFDRTEEP